jgi:hypothetical protein
MATNQHDEHGHTHHQGAAATAASTVYTCPMHAEIR